MLVYICHKGLFRFYESKLWESSSFNGSLSSKLRKSSDWCRTPRLHVMQSDHCPKTAISLITNLTDCIGWRQHFVGVLWCELNLVRMKTTITQHIF